MRSSTRLFAQVAKFLEPNSPTGLTGLTTHPSPRPALIYTYRKTLDKLQQLPTSSVYRQSVENLTKHRLAIIEEAVPEGYDAWKERITQQIGKSPEAFDRYRRKDGGFSAEEAVKETSDVWDGVAISPNSVIPSGMAEAERRAEEARKEVEAVERDRSRGSELPTVSDLEAEPPLSSAQYVIIPLEDYASFLLTPDYRIEAVENKIAAGLIEEVIVVAENELQLVEDMLKDRP
jgi:NADH dehydrogenase (ubiquinone) 1 alpha subcomplex subunit 5